jgi:NitT/TauT family transport system substrate-binding protein
MNEPEGKAQALAVLKVTLGVLYSANNKDKKLGMNVPADWEDMLTLMKTYNGLQTTKAASDFYTNAFLP